METPLNRRGPEAGEGDVAADPEGRDRTDVLGGGGSAEDDADQTGGESDLHQQRLPILVLLCMESRTFEQ